MREEFAPLSRYGDFRDVDWSRCGLAVIAGERHVERRKRPLPRAPRKIGPPGIGPAARARVVELLRAGCTKVRAAREAGVSVATVGRIRAAQRQAAR